MGLVMFYIGLGTIGYLVWKFAHEGRSKAYKEGFKDGCEYYKQKIEEETKN